MKVTMAITLIIPDVHERTDRLYAIKDELEAADRVVFLGDFFDKFGERNHKNMLRWLCTYLGRKDWDFLLGNHDASYRWPSLYACSGYKQQTQSDVDHFFGADDTYWRHFKLFTEVGPYTLSHAGFHPDTLHMKSHEAYQLAVDASNGGHYCPMFGAGGYRGGPHPIGGPVWLDFTVEFKDIEGMPQIVGHTSGKDIRQKGKSYCIDNAFHSYVKHDSDRPLALEIVKIV